MADCSAEQTAYEDCQEQADAKQAQADILFFIWYACEVACQMGGGSATFPDPPELVHMRESMKIIQSLLEKDPEAAVKLYLELKAKEAA